MDVAGPGVSFIGVFLLLLFGGGLSGTTGVTPLPEDPVVAQIAPAECLFYSSWTGKKDAAPDATSSTEQLFSDTKFLAYLELIDQRIHDAISQSIGEPEVAVALRLLKHLQTHAGVFYISEIKAKRNQFQEFRGGIVLRVDDDDIGPIVQAVKSLLQRVPSKSQSVVELGGSEFSRIELVEGPSTITWGVSGNYLVVGVGDGEAQSIIQRMQGTVPSWLVDAKKSVEIPRPASFLHLDFHHLFDLVCALSSPQEVVVFTDVRETFGFDAVKSLSYASGLDGEGCVNRGLLKITGELHGVMTLLDCKPLTAADFQQISSKSPFAIAFQFSLADALTAFLESCEHEMAPQDAKFTATALRQQIAGLDGALGVNVQEDLLASIGDTWRVFVQPGPLAFTDGWTISIDLADSDKFTEVHDELLATLRNNLVGGGPIRIVSEQHLAQEQNRVSTYITYSVHINGFPFVPAWGIHDDRLTIAISASDVSRVVSGASPPETIAGAEHIRPFLEDKSRTFKLIHVDTRAVAEFAAPLIAQQLAAMPQGGPFDASLLPPLDVLARHLKPMAIGVERTDEGVEITRRGTWPGIDIGQAAPLLAAAAIPAVGEARTAARLNSSRNNQKQVSLGLLNFESVVGAFPAGYSADENGKPLLSWRVHILPYLEQQALYNQFHLDEPWDSPHNKKLIEQMPDVYRSPLSKAEAGKTTYLGVGGADGIFVRPQSDSLTGVKIQEVTDGTSNTVVTVESTDDRAVIWTKPGDFAPQQKNPQQGLRVGAQRGMSLAFSDGSVRHYPKNTPKETLMSFFTKAGGEVIQQP